MTDEVLNGELLPPISPSRHLSAPQLQAALADAAGSMSRGEIANLAGVSASSIKAWRQVPEYRQEVDRLKSRAVELVGESVAKLKESIIEGANDGVATLRHALQATDQQGRPHWPTRLRAAEVLVEHGHDIQKRAAVHSNGQPGGSGAVTIVLQTD